ncbi:MAG: Hint domain-containing protein [Synechococcales cyanobacterium RM1_1_8]|nr:Hint domain-containing protein [Synechococcales cyanobacterium RM1_1_8]
MATTLTPGDIAIIGINADNPDNFSFVVLTAIDAGTQIVFTDNGVFSDGSFRAGENTITYTAPSDLAFGTVVSLLGNSANFDSTNFGLSNDGDQVIAYQGTAEAPTFIYAAQTNSSEFQSTATNSNTSALPPGLTLGLTAVAVGAGPGLGDEFDNSTYNELLTDGTKAELLAAISNASNWIGNNAGPIPLADGPFECFLKGTQILTECGEFCIENLKIGDAIRTAEGNLEKVKWIGYQTFIQGNAAHPFRTFPIQIKAGALGNNLPQRDLFVSPDHAILVDGLLINAGALENGVSIIATQPQESFTYYHIELEQHSLLIAEGTYAESYLPQNQGRDTFDNGDEYETLYPNHNILSLLPMSFPRVSSKRQLPRSVAKRLMAVAETLTGIKVAAPV